MSLWKRTGCQTESKAFEKSVDKIYIAIIIGKIRKTFVKIVRKKLTTKMFI